MINFPVIIFFLCSIISIASALLAVTSPDPVKSVLSLVVTFFSVAVLWLIAHAEFLALILVLVYVGAVMTLFLFVLMMLNLHFKTIRFYWMRQLPLLTMVSFSFLGLLYLATHQSLIDTTSMEILSDVPQSSNTMLLGSILYTDYILAFEIAGALLLLSIIAAITLTDRPKRFVKRQCIEKQLRVKRSDRVRLVSIPSESDIRSPEAHNEERSS